ncbi:MAG: cell division protein FtsN [Oceanospirillaceae bacterium]|jgi:cell division protein FtsN
MASRKDFAPKKRTASKPQTKKASPKTPAVSSVSTASSKRSIAARKTPYKAIIASLIAVTAIVLLLKQLTQVNPREIRESGISALIEDKINNQPATPVSPLVVNSNKNQNNNTTVISDTPKKTVKKPRETTNKQTAAIKNAAKVPVSEKSTQTKPKEPYQFYQMLAENSVETETIEAYKSTPKTAKLKNRTLLQTGSFRNAKDAERMKVRLLLNNFSKVKVSKTSSANGIWYRVRTGPFITFNQLKAALIKLNKLNISPIQVPLK